MGMSRLKKVALSVIANKLTQAEIGNLSSIFQAIDTGGGRWWLMRWWWMMVDLDGKMR